MSVLETKNTPRGAGLRSWRRMAEREAAERRRRIGTEEVVAGGPRRGPVDRRGNGGAAAGAQSATDAHDMDVERAARRIVRYWGMGLLWPFGPRVREARKGHIGRRPPGRRRRRRRRRARPSARVALFPARAREGRLFGRSILCYKIPPSDALRDKNVAPSENEPSFAKVLWWYLHAGLERDDSIGSSDGNDDGFVFVDGQPRPPSKMMGEGTARTREEMTCRHGTASPRQSIRAVSTCGSVPHSSWAAKGRCLPGHRVRRGRFAFGGGSFLHAGDDGSTVSKELWGRYGIGAEKLLRELGGEVETEYLCAVAGGEEGNGAVIPGPGIIERQIRREGDRSSGPVLSSSW